MAKQWYAPEVIEPIAFQNGGVEINPNEIFDFMLPPDDYFLLGAELNYDHDFLSFTLSADNLFNTSFRSYTDRLRYFSDSPGRNFSLTIGLEF